MTSIYFRRSEAWPTVGHPVGQAKPVAPQRGKVRLYHLAHVAHLGPKTVGHPLTCTNTILAHAGPRILAQKR